MYIFSLKSTCCRVSCCKVGIDASLHSEVAPTMVPARISTEAGKSRPDVVFQIDAACGEEQTARLQLRGWLSSFIHGQPPAWIEIKCFKDDCVGVLEDSLEAHWG